MDGDEDQQLRRTIAEVLHYLETVEDHTTAVMLVVYRWLHEALNRD